MKELKSSEVERLKSPRAAAAALLKGSEVEKLKSPSFQPFNLSTFQPAPAFQPFNHSPFQPSERSLP